MDQNARLGLKQSQTHGLVWWGFDIWSMLHITAAFSGTLSIIIDAVWSQTELCVPQSCPFTVLTFSIHWKWTQPSFFSCLKREHSALLWQSPTSLHLQRTPKLVTEAHAASRVVIHYVSRPSSCYSVFSNHVLHDLSRSSLSNIHSSPQIFNSALGPVKVVPQMKFKHLILLGGEHTGRECEGGTIIFSTFSSLSWFCCFIWKVHFCPVFQRVSILPLSRHAGNSF